MNHTYTMYVQCMYIVQTVVSTGFRGRQRDADAGQRDIPDDRCYHLVLFSIYQYLCTCL